MAQEIVVRSILQIRSGNVNYQTPQQQGAYTADMPDSAIVPPQNPLGPTPGAFMAATGTGTDASLADLGVPGWVEIANIDNSGLSPYVTWGVYDHGKGDFTPIGELLPGESILFRLSRMFGYDITGTGTGLGAVTLRIIAQTHSAAVYVGAFNR